MSTVLVVEDDAAVLRNVRKLLTLEGYEVLAAAGGREGLEIASREPPDIIVCDIMMPGIDGIEVARRLRGNTRTATIPIIFLTARTDRDSQRAGMNLGAEDYLTKPFTADELLSSIQTRLDRQKLLRDQIEEMARNAQERYAFVPHSAAVPLSRILALSEMLLAGFPEGSAGSLATIASEIHRASTELQKHFLSGSESDLRSPS